MRTPITSPNSPKLRWVAALAVITGCAAGKGGSADGGGSAAAAADSGAVDLGEADDGGAGPADTGAAAGGDAQADGATGDEGGGDEGGDADAEEARAEEGCAALILREANARDEDGDGAWRPGEALWVEATLVNDGDDAFYDAPGAELQAPADDALVPEPVVAVYSLAAGEQALLRWWAVAAPTRGEAREVPLQLAVVSAEGGAVAPCPGGAHLELRFTLSGG